MLFISDLYEKSMQNVPRVKLVWELLFIAEENEPENDAFLFCNH